MTPKVTFITGATSGIGRSCAFLFAEAGHRLILCGRRGKRLQAIKDQLEGAYGAAILTMVLDVRDRASVEKAVKSLPDDWKNIDILINNAGLALGLSEIWEGDQDEWDRMIDTNVKGLLYVSRAVLAGMTERKSGHVVNIGSIAGRETYYRGNVYCATKSAVDAISKGMRIDLAGYGIKVSQVSPGATETEFSLVRFQGDGVRAKSVYEGFTPLSPDDVAAAVFFVTTLPPHVNVDDLLLMPTSQAGATIIHRQK